MTIYIIAEGILSGMMATLIMDIWSAIAGRTGLVSKPSAALLGRWVSQFIEGKFVYADIRQSPMKKFESVIGTIIHYVIGAILGILFIILSHVTSFPPQNYLLAAVYGFLTCIFAWFWMFPSFGFGVFGKKAPPEAKLIRTSTLNHIVYGLGLAVFFNIFK